MRIPACGAIMRCFAQLTATITLAGVLSPSSVRAVPPPATGTSQPDNAADTGVAKPLVRQAAPTAVAQAKAEARIKDLFAADYAKRAPADRAALAKKLAFRANRITDPLEQFVLWHQAMNLAAAGGDAAGVIESADQLTAHFMVADAATERIDLLTAAMRLSHDPADASRVVDQTVAQCDAALAAEDYPLAVKAAALLDTAAHATHDPNAAARARDKSRQARDVDSWYQRTQPFFRKLESEPQDPDSNLRVGRFYCLVAGNWGKGLPMLAKGSEPKLKAVAERDLVGASDPDAQVALGDAWWDYAKNENGPLAAACQRHGADFYSAALKNVDPGTQERISPRIAAFRKGIDLLKTANFADDGVGGTWAKTAGGVSCTGATLARLQFHYHPPRDFDLNMTITMGKGKLSVLAMLPKPQGSFEVAAVRDLIGYQQIQGKAVDQNNASVTKMEPAFQPGKEYTIHVEVRSREVRTFVNNQPCGKWNLDDPDLRASPVWKLPDPACVGIGSYETDVIFHSVEVVEISGAGQQLR